MTKPLPLKVSGGTPVTKPMDMCEQVIDDDTRERCNKPGKMRPIHGFVLCDNHNEYVNEASIAIWGGRRP